MNHDANLSAEFPRPLVSILIRSTDRPELGHALASVAAQTYPAIEVVIVNAAGTGVSAAPAEFPFSVRVFNKQPLKRSLAANVLLDAAQGRWGLFLDDDDWLAPGHIERLAEAMTAIPKLTAAYAGVSCVEADAAADSGFKEVRRFDDPYDPVRLMVENYIPINAVLFDLETTRGPFGKRFDPDFELFEDWDFWLQLQALGPFWHVSGVSAFYRIHGNSGIGVRLENGALAEAALDQLLAKWRGQWSAESLHSLVGFSRKGYSYQPLEEAYRLYRTQTDELIKNTRHELEQRLTTERETAVALMADVRRAHENRLADEREVASALLADARQAFTDQLAAEREISRISMHAMHQVHEDRIASFENSKSWRLTRPLRDARRLAGAYSASRPLVDFKVAFFRNLLNLAMHAYRSKALAPVLRTIPATLKQRIRNTLLRQTFMPTTQTLPGSQPTYEPNELARVSIIIPVYQHVRYIEKCIRSALAQDWGDIEVIVVNDTSSDPGVRLLLDKLEGLSRLTIEHNPINIGICLTQNRALTLSSGVVIAFLDCDDYLGMVCTTSAANDAVCKLRAT